MRGASLVPAVGLALLAGLTWLAAGRAEVHVDDTEHLHVAARVAAGERLYDDVFQKQAGPFWTGLGPVVRGAGGDGGLALGRARGWMAAWASGTLLGLWALARALGVGPLGALVAPALALASPNLSRMLVIVRPDGPMWALALGGLAALAWHARGAPTRWLVAGGALLGLGTVVLLKALPLALLAGVAVGALAPPGRRGRDLAAFGVAFVAPLALWALLELGLGRFGDVVFFALRFNAAFYAVAPASEPSAWTGLAGVALAEIARVEPWMLGLGPLAALWLAARALRAARAPDDLDARSAAVLFVLPVAGGAVLAVTALPFESYFVPLELAAAAALPASARRWLARPLARRPAATRLVAGAVVLVLGFALLRHLEVLTLTPSVQRQYATLRAFEARGAEVRHYPVFPAESTPERYHRRLWYRGPMRERALATFCRLDAAGSIPVPLRRSWAPEYAGACPGRTVR